MTAVHLVNRRLLDPREAEQAAADPTAGAVNIPFSELPHRVHELPPRERELGIVGPEHLAREVIAWLTSVDRVGLAVEVPTPRDRPSGSEIGYLWRPNAFLCEVLPRLPRGMALELACGTGRDAIFMSSWGWDVTAADVLSDAISRAKEMADRYAPALRPIHWIELDLETGTPRFERHFDLITVFRYLHRPLFARLREWLRPGGSGV